VSLIADALTDPLNELS